MYSCAPNGPEFTNMEIQVKHETGNPWGQHRAVKVNQPNPGAPEFNSLARSHS